jgi:hypothetical protein
MATYLLQENKDKLIFLRMSLYIRLFSFLAFFFNFGCTVMKTEHHITLDHNISIKIEKEVNDFLDDLYGDAPESE